MAIFDTHAHYDDAAFDADRDTLTAALPANGVRAVVNAGADLSSSRAGIALCERLPFFRAAVGVHPEAAAAFPADGEAQLEALAQHPAVVAIGEIGLDYHYADACPRERQKEVFARQVALANRLSLPVIVHDREAHEDTLAILYRYRPAGVVHCFSGSVEMMREVTALGMYVGLGGAVTFKNARRPVEVAAAVPLDRLVLETDAPYMAPVPLRGRRCDSAMIAHTAARIAEIRQMPVDALLQAAFDNACRLYRLSPSDFL